MKKTNSWIDDKTEDFFCVFFGYFYAKKGGFT